MSDEWIFEVLNDTHNRAGFSCDVGALDNYIHHQAGQDQRRRIAATFVARPQDRDTIAGFYTLSSYSVALTNVPLARAKRLGKYPDIPATLLGRLAVDTRFAGKGLGRSLVINALERSYYNEIAAALVVVDALDESVVPFYKRFGFEQFPDHPLRLFLTMQAVKAAIDPVP